jgi:hypothetical protein
MPGGVALFTRMELIMVMTNSETQQKAVFRLQLRGGYMPLHELEKAGLGSVFLEEKHTKLKPLLKYMTGQKNLEDLWAYPYEIERWKEIVERHGLTGLQCLRFFTQDHRGYKSRILTLSGGSSPRIEVFLTRKGEWLVFAEGGSTGTITTHDSVQSLGRKLRTIARQSSSTFGGSYHGDGAPLILLGLHLDAVVRQTLRERAEATSSLNELLIRMEKQSAIIGQ